MLELDARSCRRQFLPKPELADMQTAMPAQNSTEFTLSSIMAARILSAGSDGLYITAISVLNNSDRNTVEDEYLPVTIVFKSSPLFLDHTACNG